MTAAIIAAAILLATLLAIRESRHRDAMKSGLASLTARDEELRTVTHHRELLSAIGENTRMHAEAMSEAAASYQLMSALASELADRQHRIECEQFELASRIQNGAGHKTLRMP